MLRLWRYKPSKTFSKLTARYIEESFHLSKYHRSPCQDKHNYLIKRHIGGGFFSKFWSPKAVPKVEVDLGQPPPCKEWPIKHDLVNTCEMIWMEKLDGMSFSVGFIDTKKERVHKGPTVLALHGSPGSHQDLLSIINPLSDHGVRVIALNFPGFGLTTATFANSDDVDIFSQAVEEKSNFVLDFLRQQNLVRKDGFDLILAQGTATPVATSLLIHNSYVFKSMALISPTPLSMPRAYGPQDMLKKLSSLCDSKRMQPYVANFIHREYPMMKLRCKEDIYALRALHTYANMNFDDVKGSVCAAECLPTPFLSVCSPDDPCTDEDQIKEWLDLLGITDRQISIFDRKGNILNEGINFNPKGRYRKCLKFIEGGHFPQDKYGEVISEEILKLLNYIRNDDKT